MSIHQRILENSLYLCGDQFDVTAIAQRLGLPQRQVRDALSQLVDTRRLVRHMYNGRATRYSRPVLNKWLCKPWTTYHPPCPTPEELTPSTAFIYGGLMHD